MSVHFSDLSRKFFEHFFKLATKTETIEPFYTDDVRTRFDFTSNGGEILEFSTKREALEIMEKLLPLEPESTHSFSAQPYNDGKTLITVKAFQRFRKTENSIEEKTSFIMTFVLAEVEFETHRFGITHQIVIQLD